MPECVQKPSTNTKGNRSSTTHTNWLEINPLASATPTPHTTILIICMAADAVEHRTPRVVNTVAVVLERLVARNERIAEAGAGRKMKVFDGVRAPSISLINYLERLYKYANCSPCCFVVGYVYMDRLLHKHPHDLLLVSLNVHRILLTALLLASKMLDDDHYDNAYYARLGGVSKAEMNRLEVELLFLLDFDLIVNAPDFHIYCLHLERELPRLHPNETPIAAATTGASNKLFEEYEDLVHEFSIQLDDQS